MREPREAAATHRGMLYSRGLFRGARRGINRGATGQMVELGRGANDVLKCGKCVELVRGRSDEFEPGDGEAQTRGGACAMGRGLYIPCSARNLARSSKARRRATSAS